MDGGKLVFNNISLKLEMPVSNDKIRIPIMAQNSFFMQKYE